VNSQGRYGRIIVEIINRGFGKLVVDGAACQKCKAHCTKRVIDGFLVGICGMIRLCDVRTSDSSIGPDIGFIY
jgi:hypothetical protein